MNMKTREVLIDANNLYVQGLIKVINDFMLEEEDRKVKSCIS